MARKTTLPLLAGLSAVGAAAGLWLGGAAIGDIDPFYFSGSPETSFVSDRMPQPPDWAQVQVGEYQQEGLIEVPPQPVVGAIYASPAVASYGESWSDAAERQAEPVRVWSSRETPVRAAEPAPADPEWEQVRRYASYPLSEQEETADTEEAEPAVYAASADYSTE